MENKPRKRIGWALILVYILLLGGLIAMTVFLTEDIDLAVELALLLLFGLSGGVAYSFYLNGDGRGWQILSILEWIAALIAGTVYVVNYNLLTESLAIAILFFMAAGLVLYTTYRRGDADARTLNRGIRWRQLGVEDEPEWEREEDPVKRDVSQLRTSR